jgi:hypothetical protein
VRPDASIPTIVNNAGTPSGWYPDPGNAPRFRYWDGVQWTDHVHGPDGASAAVISRAGNLRIASIVLAVLVWLPIGLPCGIAGAVMSKRASTAAEDGDIESATRQLNRVRTLLIVCAIASAIFWLAFTIYFVAGGPS